MSDPGVYHLNLSVYFGDRLYNQMIIIYFSLPGGKIQNIKLQI